MQILKACWALNFFLLGLVLFYIWSKMLVLSKRIAAIAGVLQEIDKAGKPFEVTSPQVKSTAAS